MKTRNLSFLLSLFFLAHFCAGFASEHFAFHDTEIENSIESCEMVDGKIYVAPDTVFITSGGIFVNFQGNVISVNSINADTNGTYFLFEDYEARYDQDWECPKCGKINNGNRVYCVRCNKRNPHL